MKIQINKILSSAKKHLRYTGKTLVQDCLKNNPLAHNNLVLLIRAAGSVCMAHSALLEA